jgi:hypothetical protein
MNTINDIIQNTNLIEDEKTAHEMRAYLIKLASGVIAENKGIPTAALKHHLQTSIVRLALESLSYIAGVFDDMIGLADAVEKKLPAYVEQRAKECPEDAKFSPSEDQIMWGVLSGYLEDTESTLIGENGVEETLRRVLWTNEVVRHVMKRMYVFGNKDVPITHRFVQMRREYIERHKFTTNTLFTAMENLFKEMDDGLDIA